jgi:hypothetical protein
VLAADAADPFAKQPTIKAPTVDAVREQVAKYLDEIKADDALRTQALALWTSDLPTDPTQTLERLALTLALADADARQLVELCSQPLATPVLPDMPWLEDPSKPALIRNNLRLLYGRWLSREKLYEESLAMLNGLEPQQVVDPASLLFYQGVAHHRLLQKEPGMKAIRRLLDDVSGQPQRYVAVAGLMYEDLKALKEESLDHIARMMEDIERRLDLGRTGPKTRKVEDDVIAALDKLIEELEKQQQQQSGGSSGSNQSSNPAQESRIMGGKGPGDVDKKNIGSKTGWGDLPPKQRQEALQQIGKDFPSHYREVIEHYFRKLAGEDQKK